MAIDIRATVTCSLGTLISASISDDYVQGNGLIKTKGSCEISGVMAPTIGTIVTFSYTQGGVTRQVPRKLRVLSSFADPFRRTTKVELGCKLTYLQNMAPAPEDQRVITGKQQQCLNGYIEYSAGSPYPIPVQASGVMDTCLLKLGITASQNPLVNTFFTDAFDLTPGYVQVLGDLLVSESYCGYLDFDEVLQVFALLQDGGTGPVLDSGQIIDISAIGVGDLPGDAVVVRYQSVLLDQNLQSESALAITKRDWEEEEVYGNVESHTVRWQSGNTTYDTVYNYKPYSHTATTYGQNYSWDDNSCIIYSTAGQGPDLSDKPIKVVQKQDVLKAEAANSYCAAVLSNGGSINPGNIGTITTETQYEYDDRGEVVKTTVITSEPYWKWVSGLNIEFIYQGAGGSEYINLPDTDVVVRKEVTTIETIYAPTPSYVWLQQGETFERSVAGQRVTRETYINSLNSLSGQQGAASTRELTPFSSASACRVWLDFYRNSLVLVDVETNISRSRIASAGQIRPARAIRLANLAGTPAEQVQRLEYISGSPTSERVVQLSMPYQSDDYYTNSGELVKSNAQAMASLYGRVQNRLLLGNRYGMGLQLSATKLPDAPYAPLVVQSGGLSVLYRCNGNSWTMDSNGIVASTDALFWGGIGGSGTFWFPVAPGIAALPATPAVVNGQMTVSSVVPVWNERVAVEGRVRTRISVQSLNYPLTLQTTAPALTLRLGQSAQRIVAVTVPTAAVTVAALSPSFLVNVAVNAPAVGMGIAAAPPAVAIGAAVRVPAALIAVSGFNPTDVGRPKTVVNAPVTALQLSATAPAVRIGSAVTIPAAAVSIAGTAPSISLTAKDPNFASVSLLLHMDGSNGSTTFTDNSSNTLTLVPYGNAQISTAQSKFGGASAYFDGTGDYLQVNNPNTVIGSMAGDFTIECWIRWVTVPPGNASGNERQIIGQHNWPEGTSGNWWCMLGVSTGLYFYAAGGGSYTLVSSASFTWNASQWYHVAVSRSSNNTRIFIDGTQSGTTTSMTKALMADNVRPVTIGADVGGDKVAANAYIDDLRITKGVARYTANFTPPTVAFPNS